MVAHSYAVTEKRCMLVECINSKVYKTSVSGGVWKSTSSLTSMYNVQYPEYSFWFNSGGVCSLSALWLTIQWEKGSPHHLPIQFKTKTYDNSLLHNGRQSCSFYSWICSCWEMGHLIHYWGCYQWWKKLHELLKIKLTVINSEWQAIIILKFHSEKCS